MRSVNADECGTRMRQCMFQSIDLMAWKLLTYLIYESTTVSTFNNQNIVKIKLTVERSLRKFTTQTLLQIRFNLYYQEIFCIWK